MKARLARALLALAPREFRQRHGEELLRVHLERRARRTARLSVVLFDVREAAGLILLVGGLRLHGRARDPGQGRGGARMLERRIQDLRFAVRTLRRNPAYAVTAVLVLALGIGANTAIFGAANAFFFRPLPFGEPDRLVMLYETNPEFGWTHETAAPANVLDWREQVEAFEDIAMYSEFVNRVTYVRDGEPELIGAAAVSGNFFDVMGVPALRGRVLRWEETWQGRDDVVVISHGLWRRMFGEAADAVGRRIEIQGTTVEVVGVMPASFNFPSAEIQLWTPWGWPDANRQQVSFRRAHWVRPIGRLAPGVSVEEADAQLQVVVSRLQREYPETNAVMGAGLMPLRDFLVRGVRAPVLALVGAVALLLLLACVNVANLALVRAGERTREIGLRRALGAGRARIVGLLGAETLLLAGAGGLLGLAVGWAGVRAIDRMTSLGIDGATGVAMDHRVVLFTIGATLLSALLFGLAPIARFAGGDLHGDLKHGDRSGRIGRRGTRVAGSLVAAEVALALLITIGAGLMVRTFMHLRSVDPGFRTENVLAVRFTIPAVRYAERDAVLAFYDRFIEAVEARPGIERAGTVGQLPLAGPGWSSQFQAEGWPSDRVGIEILHRRADAGYFDALGIPLVRGRMFGLSDRPDSPPVVLINETFAAAHFPGEDPIGQRIAYDRAADENSIWYEIIGIVGDQHQQSPALPARAEAFENRDQDWSRSSWVVLRTSVQPIAAVPSVREALRELDPLIPLSEVRPIREVWHASVAREQLVLTLLTIFGALALLLAAVGVYGVTAQAARERTREIGIRIALGANRLDVLRQMLRHGLVGVVIGLGAGTAGAALGTRALASLLFGVQPTDAGTFGAVAGVLLAVALAACWIPAHRATRVDPVTSLRAE